MAQTPENEPIEITFNRSDLGFKLNLTVDRPQIRQELIDDRDSLEAILTAQICATLLVLHNKEFLEANGTSVGKVIFGMFRPLENLEMNLDGIRNNVTADRLWAEMMKGRANQDSAKP